MVAGKQASLEAVESKLSFLANRRAHDFMEPQELAKRLMKGEVMEFKDEAEREEVTRIAEEMESKRVRLIGERRGEVIEARGMEVGSFKAGEKQEVVDKVIRGLYKEGKGKEGLLGEVMRGLVNNGSYRGKDSETFLRKVEALIAKPKKAAAGQQKAKARQ
jgi:hypothetical protein